MASGQRIELLWWNGCPSWERAEAMLREAMLEMGIDPGSLQVREIDTTESAEREGFVGSPTIRIDGEDLQPPAEGEPPGLTCRVYRRPDGSTSPLPDPGELREALRAAVHR